MLGASAPQVVAIERAKARGLRVITADNRPDNPGHRLADVSVDVSTTDTAAILEVARDHAVDGVLAYATDPAALTAAVVQDALGLPGDRVDAVRCAQNKLSFRASQARLSLPHPRFVDGDDPSQVEALRASAERTSAGLVVKPADRAGSVGLTIFDGPPSRDCLEQAIDLAWRHSFGGGVIVEERVVRRGLQFGGDYVVIEGKVRAACYADQFPFTSSSTEAGLGNLAPSCQPPSILNEATRQVEALVQALGLRSGLYNTDCALVDDEVMVIDFGARLGGNLLGEVHELAYGVPMPDVAIDLALGLSPRVPEPVVKCAAGHLVIHAHQARRVEGLQFSSTLQAVAKKTLIDVEWPQEAQPYHSTQDRLGIVLMTSPERRVLESIYADPQTHLGLIMS